MLVYYAQRGHFYAKEALYYKIRILMISIAYKEHKKHSHLFTFEELIEMGKEVFYESIKTYSFNKNAIFTTYFVKSFKYKVLNNVRHQYRNHSIINHLAKKRDFQEYSGNILEDKNINLELNASNLDLYKRLIKALKPEDQELIILWSNGYSYSEISKKYNKETKWVDNRIRLILTFLKKRKIKGLIK